MRLTEEEFFKRELGSHQPFAFQKWLGKKLNIHVHEFRDIEYGDRFIGGMVSASAVFDYICKDDDCGRVIRSQYWIDL